MTTGHVLACERVLESSFYECILEKLSNFGIFGATIGTPIINQPNVGILGTGEIKKQPIVIEKNDEFCPS